METKAVFIDRDGTINVDKGYVYKLDDFELIPGTIDALKLLTQAKISIYIVTNQAGIAKGFYSEKDFQLLTSYMINHFEKEKIQIQNILYCPHHPDGVVLQYKQICDCRKPANAHVKEVIDKQELKIENTIFIGDRNSDIEAGRNLGMRTYLVETGYGLQEKATTRATFVLKDLKSVVDHLLVWF